MKELYSTYEAKAKLSEILRQVRAGRTIRISYRGEPIAEIRPLRRHPEGLQRRLNELAERGVLVRPSGSGRVLAPIEPKPGAFDRFLAERDE